MTEKKRRRSKEPAKEAELIPTEENKPDTPPPPFHVDAKKDTIRCRLSIAPGDKEPPFRPRLVFYDTEQADPDEAGGHKMVGTVDLEDFDGWAIKFFDAHVRGNEGVDLSAWISRTKVLRRSLGRPNPTKDIEIPACVMDMKRRVRPTPSHREWLARLKALSDGMNPAERRTMLYPDLPDAANRTEEELWAFTEERPLEVVQSITRQVETQKEMAEQFQAAAEAEAASVPPPPTPPTEGDSA